MYQHDCVLSLLPLPLRGARGVESFRFARDQDLEQQIYPLQHRGGHGVPVCGPDEFCNGPRTSRAHHRLHVGAPRHTQWHPRVADSYGTSILWECLLVRGLGLGGEWLLLQHVTQPMGL